MNNVQLHLGDCLEVMRTMEANSVDSIVTDPPYMLNFMGKAFDKAKDNPAASVDVWAEALRVAKPGAHLLAFGGDRTHHRMMVAIEDAGWEIRTCLYWVFGSGFPKSLAIDKAIDAKRDDHPAIKQVVMFLRNAANAAGHNAQTINDALRWGPAVANHMLAPSRSNAICPSWEQWQQLKGLLAFGDEMDAEVWRLNGRKGKPGDAWHEREVIGKSPHGFGPNNGASLTHTMGAHPDITAPATDAAKQWQGWGTALKPAVEIIVMARKKLEGTVAANVQAWGTGGINVGACRVGFSDADSRRVSSPTAYGSGKRNGLINGEGGFANSAVEIPQGRWPANLCLDPEAAALLDEMSGTLTSNSKPGMVRKKSSPFLAHANGMEVTAAYGDTGGASRFFLNVAQDEDDAPLRFAYVPKASKRDRDEGLEGMPKQFMATMGDGIGAREHNPEQPTAWVRNHHPTVKPTALCRWLVRLVTPPGGTVLDPFMGSGSTGKAAMLEGFNFVGVELDEEYLEIARRRIEHAQGQATPRAHMPQLPLLEMTGD